MAVNISKNIPRLMDSFHQLTLEEKVKANFSLDDKIKDRFASELIDIEDFSLEFTLEETASILSKYGPRIKRLQYINFCDDIVNHNYAEIFAKYCENLEEIQMKSFEIKADNALGRLLKASKHVKCLRLYKCVLGNDSCTLISRLTILEILDLESSIVTGKGFNLLSNLAELNLKHCKNLKSEIFVQMCSWNTLKKLNIIGFRCISDADLSKIIDKLPKLENLSIDVNYEQQHFERVFKIGRLRQIHIECERLIDSELLKNYFTALMQIQKESLESIDLKRLQSPLEYDMIKPFTNLKALGLRNCTLNHLDLMKILRSACKLELLDLFESDYEESKIVEIVECCSKLRYLDISRCKLGRRIYGRLVKTRKNQGYKQQLFVFIDLRIQYFELLKSEYYCENQDIVTVINHEMRYYDDTSMLDTLESLKAQYGNKANTMAASPRKLYLKPLFIRKRCILDLNEDCLRKIIQYLSPLDRLIVILASKHFDTVMEAFIETEKFSMIILGQFTVPEAREIFSRFGHKIRRLGISFSLENSAIYIDIIIQHCKKVEELLFFEDITPKLSKCAAKLIAISAESLKKISIKMTSVSDIVEKEIAKALNLEAIIANYSLTGKSLNAMTKLKNLTLCDFPKLEAVPFMKICRSNQLKTLSISCSHNTYPWMMCRFDPLVETQKNLESLTMKYVDSVPHCYAVAGFVSLTQINFIDCNANGTALALIHLSKPIGNQLKSLKIWFSRRLDEYELMILLPSICLFPNLLFLELLIPNKLANYKKIFESSPKLEVLSFPSIERMHDLCLDRSEMALDNDVLMVAIDKLQRLSHFNLGILDANRAMDLVRRTYMFKKARNDTVPLIFHVKNDDCQQFLDTQEYKSMETFVTLSIDPIWFLNYEALTKKKKCIRNLQNVSPDRPSLDLPDKCLREIASKLSNIDKLSFAFTNKRIFNVIKPIAHEIIFNINEISRVFTLCEARELFYELRDQIHCFEYSITTSSDPVEYVKLIEPYGGGFRKVFITKRTKNSGTHRIERLFVLPKQKLETLSIHLFELLECVLKIILDKDAVGMNPLQNLTELSFIGSELLPSQFSIFCRNCQLKKLDITGCRQLKDESFAILLKTQNDCLEHLAVSCEYGSFSLMNLARLSKLKHIQIQIILYSLAFDAFLEKLIKYHRCDLLSLEILLVSSNFGIYSKVGRLLEEKRGKFLNLEKFLYESL